MGSEHAATTNKKKEDVEQLYKRSIDVARDHGNIHELGLAYKLFGNYYSKLGCESDSKHCYRNAYQYFIQWGANAVAEKLVLTHDLDLTTDENDK